MQTIRITDLEKPIQSPAMLELLRQFKDADISLDGQTLLELAQQQVQIPLDIDDGLVTRFTRLFDEIIAQAPTHNVGRYTLQQIAVNGIAQTTYMNHIFKTYPAANTSIEKPLIVAGLPRSGTTHLLQLLTTAPELLWMKTWETRQPFPSPAMIKESALDNREELGVAALKTFVDIMPLQPSIYDAGPYDSTEEIEAMVHGCYGLVPNMLGDAPAHDTRYYGQDRSDDYQYLYKQLQALQWIKGGTSEQRWLLKSPAHLGVLPTINKVFPDASVVFTHRDPASVFSSLINLLGYGTRAYYDSISKDQLVGKAKRMLHGFLRGAVDNANLFEGRSTHLYFHELKRDVIEYVEKIYALIGLEYDDAAKARVAEQAKKFSRDHSGKRIVYDIQADFGISRDQIREEFSYYLDKYPVEIEESHR